MLQRQRRKARHAVAMRDLVHRERRGGLWGWRRVLVRICGARCLRALALMRRDGIVRRGRERRRWRCSRERRGHRDGLGRAGRRRRYLTHWSLATWGPPPHRTSPCSCFTTHRSTVSGQRLVSTPASYPAGRLKTCLLTRPCTNVVARPQCHPSRRLPRVQGPGKDRARVFG